MSKQPHRYTLTGYERTGLDGWREWQVVRDDGKGLWIKNSRRKVLRREGRLIEADADQVTRIRP